jgi:hypothetical protein
MDFLESALEYVGIAGQLLLFYFLLRGPFRRYYLVFIYALVEMLGTFADKYVGDRWGRGSVQFHDVYFSTEMFGDLLLLVVLILFTYQLMEDSPVRGKVRRVLGVIGLGAGLLPFVLFGSAFSGAWYNSAIQVYNFGGAIMMLALWTAVIARKTRDRQLLLVCAGLGIALAGNAALWGMRKFTGSGSDARSITTVLIQVMYLIRLGIWSWAFRPQRPAPTAPVKSFAD